MPWSPEWVPSSLPAILLSSSHVARIRRSDSLESVALYNGIPPINLEEDAVDDSDGAASELAHDLHTLAPEKPRDPNTAIMSGELHKRCVNA
jgi:hypothetical protein